jgi:hypothetical protein
MYIPYTYVLGQRLIRNMKAKFLSANDIQYYVKIIFLYIFGLERFYFLFINLYVRQKLCLRNAERYNFKNDLRTNQLKSFKHKIYKLQTHRFSLDRSGRTASPMSPPMSPPATAPTTVPHPGIDFIKSVSAVNYRQICIQDKCELSRAYEFSCFV